MMIDGTEGITVRPLILDPGSQVMNQICDCATDWDPGPWSLDPGPWTLSLDLEPWTLNPGHLTRDT
jgi:hypothetical protein